MMKFFSLFSESEFSLRLPSLLGFALYGFFTLLIIQKQSLLNQLFFSIPVILLNNYLIDFFSLARGYGLSLGLMMGSIYFLLNPVKSRVVSISLNLSLALLAVLANLNLLNYFIADVLLILFLLVKTVPPEQVKRIFIRLIPAFVVSGCVFFLLVKRLLLLKENGQLYFGTDSAMHSIDSIFIWSYDLSILPDWFLLAIHYLLPLLLSGAVILIVKRRNFSGPLFIICTLVILMAVGLAAEHMFFNALYPLNRTFLYSIPLLGLLGGFFIQELESTGKKFRIALVCAVFLLITGPVLYQFVRRMNVNMVAEWGYDSGTRQAAFDLADKAKGSTVRVGHNWMFGPALRYYVVSRHLPLETFRLDEPVPDDLQFIYEFCGEKRLLDSGWKTFKTLKNESACLYQK
jgi:hypothetical protein